MNQESSTLMSDWFGEEFENLHPTLQLLNTQGGTLEGKVVVFITKNPLVELLAKSIAKNIGFPTEKGIYDLNVNVTHTKNTVNWARTFRAFNKDLKSESVIKPVGIRENGFLLEESGTLKWRMTVLIKNKAWHWKWVEIKYKTKHLSKKIFHRTTAVEYIDNNGQYVFKIAFGYMGIGKILSYHGTLHHISSENTTQSALAC